MQISARVMGISLRLQKSLQPRTGPDKFPVQLGLASSDLGLFLPLVYHDREVWSAEVNTHSSDMIKRMKMTYLAIEI